MLRTLFLLIFSLMSMSIAGQTVKDLHDLGGMSGCWERRDDAKKLLITEYWMSPAGTSMLGMGRTVKSGTTTGWEFMRIEKRDDGFYFVSRPRENNEDTAFKLVASDDESVTFENKEHDFPQRVIYRVKGNLLSGRIEGTNKGKFLAIDFPMTRVKCPYS